MLTFKHGQINCATFAGIGDLADYVTSGPAAACPYMTSNSDWAGASAIDTLRYLGAGDDKLTARADAALARVEASADFMTSRFAVVAAVAGGAPCVPSYLAGNPLAMRRRVQIASDSAPIAVCIDLGVSASVSAETIERRGVAALALARVLSASRAVSLWAVCGEQISQCSDDQAEALFAVKIDTAPIDVARTAWLMAAPEAFRRVGFAACQAIGGHPQGKCVNWLFDDGKKHLQAVADLLPQLTGCSEMVYLPRLWTDGADQFETDKQAAAWVRAELLRLGALAE